MKEANKQSKVTDTKLKSKPVLSSRCPKCGITQSPAPECKACGVIFSRYVAAQKRKEVSKQQVSTDQSVPEQKSGFGWLQLVVVVLITFGLTYYFLGRD